MKNMKNLLLKTIILTFIALPAFAGIAKNITVFSLDNLQIIADNTLKVTITVDDENAEKPFSWDMVPSDIAVLYNLLEKAPNDRQIISKLKIKNPSSGYKGLIVSITNKYGEKIEPFRIYNNSIKHMNGNELIKDVNRNIEYTVWGMNYSSINQEFMWKMIPIISFKKCVKLGNKVVETTPRQCIIANNDIFLDVEEPLTQQALGIKDFEDCLIDGQAIINTFPRRCIAAGGHVFTEAPKIR